MSRSVARTPYAGFVTRTLALALDALIINATMAVAATVIGLIASLFGADLKLDVTAVVAGAGFWFLLTTSYFVAFWTLAGQTPGMRLLGLKVLSTNGDRLGVGQALRRLVGMALSMLMLGLGFALVLIDQRRQGLHDKIARTLVLYVEPSSTPAQPALIGTAP